MKTVETFWEAGINIFFFYEVTQIFRQMQLSWFLLAGAAQAMVFSMIPLNKKKINDFCAFIVAPDLDRISSSKEL